MRIPLLLIMLLGAGSTGAASVTVYDGQLQNGFVDYYSWAASYSFSNASPVYAGASHSLSFKPDNWGGVRVLSAGNGTTLYPFANYSSLTFWVNGRTGGGQVVTVDIQRIDTGTGEAVDYGALDIGTHTTGGAIPANAWQQVTIDFDALGLTYGSFNALTFQANSSTAAIQPVVYFDDVVFNARSTAIADGGTVDVSVNATIVGNTVSPLIFGVAYGDATRNQQMHYTVDRWGGNSTTRYNWQRDIHNTANDYYFENIPDCTAPSCTGSPPAGNSADTFLGAAFAAAAQPLLTIPTIGWTPRADSALQHPYTVGFSVAKYGAQQSVDQYDPNAGNGYSTNGNPITDNDPADSSTAVDPTFAQAWIAHLQSTFGTAANGGVKYYTLDNEVMLWNSTHRDVHPAPPTQAEIWNKTQSYATAIKQQEPNALVTGPVTWGYCDLFWSAQDNCGQSSEDRNAHGGLPFVAWYLQQVCANRRGNGQPLVDYLDLHYYAAGQGVSLSDDDSPATAALRLRSLKELYDPAWVSESWIADLGNGDSNHYAIPDLIPRVKGTSGWIPQYCPGTRLAITEYNWGNDNTTSGAVAQAEVLAIYAREGVDLATRWIAPAPGSTVENAFSIFLNYDGAGSRVQGASIATISTKVDQVGAYAFHGDQRMFVLLTNKDYLTHDVALTFAATHTTTWKLYGFTGSSALATTGTGSINGTSLALPALPPMSASLLVIPDADEIFRNGFEVGP